MRRPPSASRAAARRCARALLLATWLAGCASQGGLTPHARLTVPGDLPAAETLAAARLEEAAWPDVEWWHPFGDPQLDALEAEALGASPSLAIARARVHAARAAADVVRAALLPRVNATLDDTWQRYSDHGTVPPPVAGSWHSANGLVLDLDYHFDFAGADRAAFAAATSAAQAERVDAIAARLLLTVAVARGYVQLARICDQRDIARAELARRRHIHELTARRVSAGIDDRVALKQAQAAVPIAEERIAVLDEAAALVRHQLAALLGAGPDRALSLRRPDLAPDDGDLALPSRLPVDLLGRRPDVVAERWRVEAASRRVDAARARFYPDVDLRVFAGVRSIGLSRLFDAGSGVAGIGQALHLPIFEGGRLRARLDGADAAYELAVEGYNRVLIEALRDFADRLASIRSVAVQADRQRVALEATADAYELALARYRGGLGSYLEVLSAEGMLLGQQRLRADLTARARVNRIELVRALGGGLEVRPPDALASAASPNQSSGERR